ncbi:MAG: hypothetical protein GX569_15205 [Candidatus Riflebacteria bacterium]|nr:hypothetical protein [Candidatus Riflebacteria bacterium]
MQLIETVFMLIEAFFQLVVGLLKIAALCFVLCLIISNPLLFLLTVVFMPGLLTFVVTFKLS